MALYNHPPREEEDRHSLKVVNRLKYLKTIRILSDWEKVLKKGRARTSWRQMTQTLVRPGCIWC